ncbi:hypothetical protein J3R30DRAFT_2728173 [Lentinula aciculospora]|uniref:RING-type domain-containing protein n=1 Tax=Lentinula aciculospora TaxID=153920 RepID=A0A9W9ACZ5_9AGAR|nr:hypothetical protein J3R30DRAFT_2728173 [Lentinula aciculospora]
MGADKGKRKRSTRSIIECEQIVETCEAGSSRTSPSLEAPVVKRSRHRAETRDCPICNEPIPLRLLRKHAELEASRVDEIIGHIGSEEPFLDLSYESYASTSAATLTSEPVTRLQGRRSAVRARQSILEKTAPVRAQWTVVTKAIQSIKRNRKNRHGKLRDMTREDDEGHGASRIRYTSGRGEIVCPVCLVMVGGDEDVQDAHIEACIANESVRLEEERLRREEQEREEAEEVDIGDDDAAGHFGDVRGTGFHTRNHHEQDVEDDIDIDGDDAENFGSAQFHEGDILDIDAPTTAARTQPTSGRAQFSSIDDSCPEPELEVDQPAKVLRELIADSRTRQNSTSQDKVVVPDMDKAEVAILMAKSRGNQVALVIALENKIKLLEGPLANSQSSASTVPLCRICIEPYNEPTASTGCWHTCCRECWLRCLGSTKLCPICKRITAATDLRRVYL